GARRAARRDLVAPGGVRHAARLRLQPRPRGRDHARRAPRRARQERVRAVRWSGTSAERTACGQRARDCDRRCGHGRTCAPEGWCPMFGLDQWVVHFSDGTTLLIVLVVAVLLGLRHASDPDNLTAVTTLVTNGRGGATRLGFTWG